MLDIFILSNSVICNFRREKSKLSYYTHGVKSKLLGIFEGKKSENNKLILKSLVFGSKTTTQIAEYIYHNRSEKPKPKDTVNVRNEVRKIIAIISRRTTKQKGRIFELEDKGYISRENNLWQVTSKGLCVGLTQFNSIMEVYPYVKIDVDIDSIERAFSRFPIGKAVKKSYPRFNIRKILTVGKSPELFQFWKDYTNELISLGVDLDRMNDFEFKGLLASRSLTHLFKPELSEIEKLSRKTESVLGEEG